MKFLYRFLVKLSWYQRDRGLFQALLSPDGCVVFFQIPKVASSSMISLFRELLIKSGVVSEEDGSIEGYPLRKLVEKHTRCGLRPYWQAQNVMKREGVYSFAIVRDPWNRLVSACFNSLE
jgi:hypothetical protein